MPLQAVSGANANNNLLNNYQGTGVKDASAQKTGTEDVSSNIKTNINTTSNTEASKKSNFIDHLISKVQKEKPDSINMSARLDDIKHKGRVLRQHPLPHLVKEYVTELKDFLTDVKDNAYETQEKDELFEKVKVVDKKLDELADKLMAEQKSEIDLVASLGELEGLLVDIFV